MEPSKVNLNAQLANNGNVGGFEQGQGFTPVPPPAQPSAPAQPLPHSQFASCAELTEAECREALLQFAAEHCCYGKGPAKNMKMKEFLASTALYYKLETFCENRTTGNREVPFYGQPIDGPENGPPPGPWQMEVLPSWHFIPHVKEVEVPHTATVKTCHACNGRGSVTCSSCNGRGSTSRHDSEKGWTRETCSWCHGHGTRTCSKCDGHGRLKCYLALSVTFLNHVGSHIIETTDLPDDKVRIVEGNTVLQDTYLYCQPIVGYPVPEIAEESIRIIEEHKVAFPSERRLNQRQTLIAIPVTEIHYDYAKPCACCPCSRKRVGADHQDRFWVFGLDKKVWFPDYPATCCWGCSIL